MSPDESLLVMAACLAVVASVMVFAVLLLAGVRIVRVLGLPQDLPDGPRFEPPPPELRPRGDRDAARAVAVRQRRSAEIHRVAFGAFQQAMALKELDESLLAPASAEGTAAVATIRASAAAAATAADAAALAMRDPDLDAAAAATSRHAAAAQTAYDQAMSAARILPQPSQRRLLVLIVLAVVVFAWLVVIILMGTPHGTGPGSLAH